MLYPVHLMLSLFLSSKYTIKDDYITPKGKTFYIATFAFILILYGLGINRVFFDDLEDTMGTDNRDIITIIFSFSFVFYSIGFGLIFVLNYIHSDCSISFILTLQEVFNSLDFSDSIVFITHWNWFSMSIAFGVNVFLYMLYYITYHAFNPVDVVMDIMFITFDMNLVYGILVITWLRKFLEKWIEDVLAYDDVDEEFYRSYFQVYRNILIAYNLYKSLFQLLVLFHTADTFFRCLCLFAVLLQVLQIPDSGIYDQMVQYTVVKVLAAVWQLKDILLVVVQSIECEKFYITVEEVETACIQRLKNKHHLGERSSRFL
uniref:Gustatory receptor n=1 Tax=Heliothis virescens TaxID=7102 RepID=A0A2A4K7F9_HELVI